MAWHHLLFPFFALLDIALDHGHLEFRALGLQGLNFTQAVIAIAQPGHQDQADGHGVRVAVAAPGPGRGEETPQTGIDQDQQEGEAVNPGKVGHLKQHGMRDQAVAQEFPGKAADDVGQAELEADPEDRPPPHRAQAPGLAPVDPQGPAGRIEAEVGGQQQQNADGKGQGQEAVDVGDVNDPVEQNYVMGQAGEEAQAEGRFE